MKYIKSFGKYNKINEAASGGIIGALKGAAIESTNMNDYFEANRFLSKFISDNQEEISEANGNDIVSALEPWYDQWHEAWEKAETPTSSEIEIDDDTTTEIKSDDSEVKQTDDIEYEDLF